MNKREALERLRIEEMLGRIQKAKQESLSLIELERRKDVDDAIGRAFLLGQITGKEYEERSDMEDTPQGRLDFCSEEDLELAMRLLKVDKETLEWTLKHERQHFNAAVKAGFDPRYVIQFARSDAFYPGVHFDNPGNLSDEEFRHRLIEVMEVPEELSPRDQSVLGTE